jgi:radical SAM superfamily enzyme YgiQ (UPF0313 family)
MSKPFRLTVVHPCIGRHVGMKKYIRTWMMEPIPVGMVLALTPDDVEKRFYDDRVESIPYDEPTDLVAMSVETYTAKRCYQIASEYRKRGVPVVMGGFHATLCPDEVARYCETLVIGEAETVWPEIIDDYRHGRPKALYRAQGRPVLGLAPDRSLFGNKGYLPIKLVEFARGCKFRCDFCAITSFFQASHNHRPVDRVVEEIQRIRRPGQMFFFIDDNITSDLDAAKELMRALIPLKVRWVSQSAINVAHDEEALELMQRSGCQGVLVGFESLDEAQLRTMKKGFNLMKGGPAQAMDNFRRHNLRIYGTFLFGYDEDTTASFARAVDFAKEQGMFIAAFNHVTPFPGTPLYKRMQADRRLTHDPWWLDDRYKYNMIPFEPKRMTAQELTDGCVWARKEFYSWKSIFQRGTHKIHWRSPFMLGNFLLINAMHQVDVSGRNGLPLGDAAWNGTLIPAARGPLELGSVA